GIASPFERLHATSARLDDLKESKQALAGEAITSLGGFAPAMLLTLGMRVATRAARRMGNLDTVTTNVPGPQFPLYCCGRRLLKARPYVPLAAPLRVGVAIFSYDGEMSFGITGDYDTAPDIGVLAAGISEGLAELLPTNGHPVGTNGDSPSRATSAATAQRPEAAPTTTGTASDPTMTSAGKAPGSTKKTSRPSGSAKKSGSKASGSARKASGKSSGSTKKAGASGARKQAGADTTDRR